MPYFYFWSLILDRLSSASLILQKIFSRSSFYEIAGFSIFASGSRLDVTITSDTIWSYHIQLWTTYVDASLVLGDILVGPGFHL